MSGREWREGRGLDPRLKLNKKLGREVFHFSRGPAYAREFTTELIFRIHNGILFGFFFSQ